MAKTRSLYLTWSFLERYRDVTPIHQDRLGSLARKNNPVRHVSSRCSGPPQIWRHKLLPPSSPLAVCSVGCRVSNTTQSFCTICHIWWGTAVCAGGGSVGTPAAVGLQLHHSSSSLAPRVMYDGVLYSVLALSSTTRGQTLPQMTSRKLLRLPYVMHHHDIVNTPPLGAWHHLWKTPKWDTRAVKINDWLSNYVFKIFNS